MSFTNLIPVCKNCNETYKLGLPFCLSTHIHPYHDDYDSLCCMECEVINSTGAYEINILLNDDGDVRSKRFNLELGFTARYNHSAVTNSVKSIVTLIKRHYGIDSRLSYVSDYDIPMEEYVEAICQELNIPFTKKEILRHLFGKAKRDVAIQAGLIERT